MEKQRQSEWADAREEEVVLEAAKRQEQVRVEKMMSTSVDGLAMAVDRMRDTPEVEDEAHENKIEEEDAEVEMAQTQSFDSEQP